MRGIYHCYIQQLAEQSFELPSILYLKKQGQFCFYNPESDGFYTPDLNSIDITGKEIIPHNFANDEMQLFHKAIREHGGIISKDIEQIKKVYNWLDYYTPKRRMRKISGRELIEPEILSKIEQLYGSEIFFKTLEKSYSEIVKTEYLKIQDTIIGIALERHLDDVFIISEVVDILKDDIGNKEYRVFVFDNQILNISRHTNVFLHKIDYSVYQKAQQIVDVMKIKGFPSSYVVDLFEYMTKDGNIDIDVVEFNGFSAAGRYLYNSVSEIPTLDMLHENILNIAIEKRDLVNLCLLPDPKYKDFVDGFTASKYCDMPGSFANDLKVLNGFNNVMTFDNKFDLGRRITEYNNYVFTEQNNTSIRHDVMFDIVQAANREAKKIEKEMFFRNLTLEDCPADERYLTSNGLPEEEQKEIPKVMKLNPNVLKCLKEKYGK